ncbi:MAG: hypothetical protein CME21_09585 [Gemmatimonadetes bacterium]|nr:hypothetical protein [Gemmatimonadota bacterium]
MKRIVLLVATLMVWAWPSYAKDGPRKALCPVCAVRGEMEKEVVRAHAEHDGKAYYLCSKNCKKEFDADPLAYARPKLPRPLPDFSVEALDGDVVNQTLTKGKLVLLDFWATWCKPCVYMMSRLQVLYDAYAKKGLMVMGVSIDDGKDRVKKIEKFVDKIDVTYPVYSDARPTPAWHTFKVKAIPALFLIKDQEIVAQWLGNIDHADMESEIRKHLH